MAAVGRAAEAPPASLAALSRRITEAERARDRSLVAWQQASPADEDAYDDAMSTYWQSNSDLVGALRAFHEAWKAGQR